MKRSAFKRRLRAEGPTAPRETKPWAAALVGATLKPITRGSYSGGISGRPIDKEEALQHAGYEAAVRDLGYCMRCLSPCRPQFCHADMGKGGGIKTDSRQGWPGCDHCHAWLGGHAGGGRMPKEQRRGEEAELARRTRAAVIAAGTWPKRLPMWEES